MSFTTSCFIRKNTPELRQKLVELGHTICRCCEFEGAEWLTVTCNPNCAFSVHGWGFWSEDAPFSFENRFNSFLEDNEKREMPMIDCGINEDLFLALVALRNDIPDYQWFLWEHNDGEYHPEDNDSWKQYIPGEHWQEWWWFEVRKATTDELIKHFNKK